MLLNNKKMDFREKITCISAIYIISLATLSGFCGLDNNFQCLEFNKQQHYNSTSPFDFVLTKSSKGLPTISKGYDTTAVHKTHEMPGPRVTARRHDVLVYGVCLKGC